jgi:hypothetical protein
MAQYRAQRYEPRQLELPEEKSYCRYTIGQITALAICCLVIGALVGAAIGVVIANVA